MDEQKGPEPRRVYLSGEVDTDKAQEVVEAIHLLSFQDMLEPVELHLVASSGGDAMGGMAVVDAIQSASTAPVHTYAWAEAASISALILAAGARRFVSPHVSVMVHGMSLGLERESTAAMVSAAKAYDDMECRAYQWLDRVTDQEVGYWRGRVEREGEIWLSAEQAVQLGLADLVLPRSQACILPGQTPDAPGGLP